MLRWKRLPREEYPCGCGALRYAVRYEFAYVAQWRWAGCDDHIKRPEEFAVRDLKLLFSELIRYETELWNAIDARQTRSTGMTPLSTRRAAYRQPRP